MKIIKITLFFILLFLITDVKAQITKNSFMLGAVTSLDASNISQTTASGNKTNLPTTYKFFVNPKLGYFVADNLALGIDINFNFSKDTTTNSSTTASRTNFLIGPFGRYYFQTDDNIYLFLEANVGIGLKSSEATSMTTVGGGIGPGLSFFLSDNIAFEALGKYNFLHSSNKTDKHNINNVNLSLGMIYYFRAMRGGLK